MVYCTPLSKKYMTILLNNQILNALNISAYITFNQSSLVLIVKSITSTNYGTTLSAVAYNMHFVNYITLHKNFEYIHTQTVL